MMYWHFTCCLDTCTKMTFVIDNTWYKISDDDSFTTNVIADNKKNPLNLSSIMPQHIDRPKDRPINQTNLTVSAEGKYIWSHRIYTTKVMKANPFRDLWQWDISHCHKFQNGLAISEWLLIPSTSLEQLRKQKRKHSLSRVCMITRLLKLLIHHK